MNIHEGANDTSCWGQRSKREKAPLKRSGGGCQGAVSKPGPPLGGGMWGRGVGPGKLCFPLWIDAEYFLSKMGNARCDRGHTLM
jgi:hypothetical protein